MKLIDLHTHSTCSDGTLTPEELVIHAKESGLSAIALSDHDTVNGIKEAMAAGKKHSIEVIPAIEFSAEAEAECHILGFFINPEAPSLKAMLSELIERRRLKGKLMCEALNECGFDITEEELKKESEGATPGRVHLARLLMGKGYVSSVNEAFDKYLAKGKPGYRSVPKPTPAEVISAIEKAGGKAYAAHLHLLKKNDEELEGYLKELKDCGLCGVEGYYTEYTPEMFEKYNNLAKKLDLKISGGSDFHGSNKPHIAIGKGFGNLEIPYSVLENMKK